MMGWTPPTASMRQSGGVKHHLRETSVSEVIIIGLDIAKYVFQVHGAVERGRAIFSKWISRGKLLDFFAAHPRCTVALEACVTVAAVASSMSKKLVQSYRNRKADNWSR